MIIIGEKINSTFKAIKPLIENCDKNAIQELAKKQYDAGATYIDIHTASANDEASRMEWIVNAIQEVTEVPFSINSSDPAAIEKALKANKNPKPLINSISDQSQIFESVAPLIAEYKTGAIILCMNDEGMPETVDDRIVIADKLINGLVSKGVEVGDLIIDPVVRPVGTDSKYGLIVLDSIRKLKKEYPKIHITCNLSNISLGIPARTLMNQVFLIAAMTAGMDSVILDPLDIKTMSVLCAGNVLLGMDDFCMDYLMKFREGLLEI